MGEALRVAMDRLTIWDVWRESGLPYSAHRQAAGWGNDGFHLSPLRAESNPSFHVFRDGKLAKDFGGEFNSGAMEFARVAFGDISKGDLAKRLIALAGCEHLDTGEKPDPKQRKKLDRQREKEARLRISDAAKKAWAWPSWDDMAAGEVQAWPDVVSRRWFGGVRACREHENPWAYLTRWRGWPVELCVALLKAGAISCPVMKFWPDEPSSTKRAPAFRVAMPWKGELLSLGYHQVWLNRKSGRKGWIFYPCVPREPKCGYDRELAALGRSIPSVPFFLGDWKSPKKINVLEGQWDAATYHWQSGGFEREGVLTLGLRGTSSWRLALAAWGHLFEGARVTIIPDNDQAGQQWVTRSKASDVPCFADIVEQRAASVIVKQIPAGLTLKSGGPVKDFNDLYRLKRDNGEW